MFKNLDDTFLYILHYDCRIRIVQRSFSVKIDNVHQKVEKKFYTSFVLNKILFFFVRRGTRFYVVTV